MNIKNMERKEDECSLNISESEADNLSLLELHDAARKYDPALVQELLDERRCDVQVTDSQGRNALHALLEDGFLGHLHEKEMTKCIKFLLEFNINVNLEDRLGVTPLMLAVDNAYPSCASLLLEAGAKSSIGLAKKIGHTMPDLLLQIFDDGVILDDESKKGETLVKLDWGPVVQFSATENVTGSNQSFKMKQKESQFLYDLLDVKSEVRKKLYGHPLVASFIYLKNTSMSRRFRWFYIISTLFPIAYGVLIYFLYFVHCKCTFETVYNNRTDTEIQKCVETHCDISIALTSLAGVLLFLIATWTFVEIYMLLRVDIKYLSSWRTWVLRAAFLVMGVTLWPALFYKDGYNITWQYPIASLGIFLSWVMFLMQMGLYERFSIYLEMLVKILISVLKIILTFLPLFIGFFFGFKLLFTDMDNIFQFIMMSVDTGSVAYDQLTNGAKQEDLWFKVLAYLFSVGFLVVIVIVFMNFLLALSIRDVETLKRQAKLASTCRTIQNIFLVDLLYAHSVLISETDLREGRYFYTFNPTEAKQKLPKSILMSITELLKQKKDTDDARRRRKIEDTVLLRDDCSETSILTKRIKELDQKLQTFMKN